MNCKKRFYLILLLMLLLPYAIQNSGVNSSKNNHDGIDRSLNGPMFAGENCFPSFNQTGPDLDISVEQEYVNTSLIMLDPNTSGNNSLSVPTPCEDYSTTSIELNVSSVDAGGLDNIFSGDYLTGHVLDGNSVGAQTFYVPGDGAYLSKISLLFFSEIYDNTTFCVFIRSTVWDDTLGCNKPTMDMLSFDPGKSNASDSVADGYSTWNHEFDGLYLNNSITDNNTWFIMLFSFAIVPKFYWCVNDVDVNDDLFSFYYNLTTYSWEILSYSNKNTTFAFNYTLSASNSIPLPSDIGLMVNSTSVSDATSGVVGHWFNTTPHNGGAEKQLEFVFSCNWSLVSLTLSSIRVVFHNEFTNTSKYIVYSPNSPYVNWNLSCDLSVLEPQLSNYRVNFTVPDSWQDIYVFKAGEDIPLTTTLENITTSNFKLVSVDSGLDQGYYTVSARSPQIDASIDISRNGLETNAVYSSDLIEISFCFNALITSSLNVSFYADNQIHYSTLVDNPTPTNEIIYHNGLFDDLLQRDFNNYVIVILWYNGTDAIYYSKSFSYLLKTDLEIKKGEDVLQDYTKDSFMLIHLSYNELNGSKSLDAVIGANISLISESEFQYSVNFNESTQCYDVLIDCSSLGVGQHSVKVNANKQFCQSQSVDVLIKIVEKQAPIPEKPWWQTLLIYGSLGLGLVGIIVLISKLSNRKK